MSLLKTYKENESANLHSENAALLANAFGTEGEKREASFHLKNHESLGYATRDSILFQAEMSRKYYSRLKDS